MAGYNRNRNYQFEPGEQRPPRDTRRLIQPGDRDDRFRFDEEYPAQRSSQRPSQRPQQRPVSRRPMDDDDQFDNYRPGTMLGMADGEERPAPGPMPTQPERRRSARVNDNFEERFVDDFDDEIVPRRKAEPPSIHNYRPPKRGYSRANNYGEDYDEEQFQNEFGGVRGLGVRQRKLTDEEQIERRRRERREREMIESDGYRSSREMMVDHAYDGSVGVPKLFADYFREDYVPQRRVMVTGGKSTSYAARRAGKLAAYAMTAVLVIAIVTGAVIFISSTRVKSPLIVSTALSSMDENTSMQLVKNTVDGTLSTKSMSVSYTGSAGQSGEGLFRLADCGFEYTTNEDGTIEYIEVKDAEGNAVNHTFKTRGSIRYDETAVINFLNDLVGEDGEPMREPYHEVKLLLDPETWEYSAELVVTAGVDGYGIDYNKFVDQAMNCIETGMYDPISTELQITETSDIDVESIYKQVYKEPADAFSVTDGMGQVTYTEHVIGMDFSTSELQQIINGSNETEWTMDLKVSVPKVTIQELRKDECPDLLATYYTEFNANNAGRTSNIKKCCEYINNYYLDNPMQPGDVFSFNTVVGERTPDRGFSKATVYSSEGTDEDYGGGICQVSSTLYYTTILANLETVHRRNHMFTVSYMWNKDHTQQTFHNDATVNWGTCDYQFRNSKQYPIRLELIVSGGTLTCNIWGTWDGFTADIFPDEQDTEPFQTIYHKSAKGKSNQAGQLGRVIDSYRKVYYNGEPYYEKNIFECTSSYLPLMQVRYVDAPPAGKQFDVAY